MYLQYISTHFLTLHVAHFRGGLGGLGQSHPGRRLHRGLAGSHHLAAATENHGRYGKTIGKPWENGGLIGFDGDYG